MDEIFKWDAKTVLNVDQLDEQCYAFIVLNRPILFDPADFQRLWNKGINYDNHILNINLIVFYLEISATLRVLVDGGANQWFKFNSQNNLDGRIEPPHLLTGDMDSVTEESLHRLDDLKCQRINTPDQMDTDCTKSLIAIKPYLESIKVIYLELRRKHFTRLTHFNDIIFFKYR